MKLKLISTLIAASFLAGCSSNGSSNDTDSNNPTGVADVHVFEGENANLAMLSGDQGEHNAFLLQSEEHNIIVINGEYFTVSDGLVYDSNNQAVGTVDISDGQATLVGLHGASVTLEVVDGRLIASDITAPIDPDYDNGLPLWGEEGAKELKLVEVEGIGHVIVIGDKPVGVIDGENRVIINGEVVGSASGNGDNRKVISLNNGATIVADSNTNKITIDHADGTRTVIDRENGSIISDNAPDFGTPWMPQVPEYENPINDIDFEDKGKQIIFTKDGEEIGKLTQVERGHQDVITSANIVNSNGDKIGSIESIGTDINNLYQINITEGQYAGTYYFDRNNGQIHAKGPKSLDVNLSAEQKQELKSKIQSLSQEQRQQIKQAVKDRVNRS
ncbi:hypothetical protein [Vibrio cionasavignyae]|uniref:hypothetical protein n=1 Tax=Vibrio cionasavignyae TaxID=2910252 RepID=UPI003D0F434C